MKRNLIVVTVVTGLLAFAGCQKAPNEKVTLAESTIDSARTAEAEVYSGDLFKSATISLDLAKSEIEAQNKKFLMKDFTKATELLESSIQAANSAKNDVTVNKTKLQQEVQQVLGSVQLSIDSIARINAAGFTADSLLVAQNDSIKTAMSQLLEQSATGNLFTVRESALQLATQADSLTRTYEAKAAEAAATAAASKAKPAKKKK